MSNLAILLTIGIFIHTRKAASCRFVGENSPELQEILKIKGPVDKNKSFIQISKQTEFLEAVDPNFANFCSEIRLQERIAKNAHDLPVLEKDYVSYTISVDFDEQKNAVKVFTFEQFITHIILAYNGNKLNKLAKFEPLLECIRTFKFLEARVEGEEIPLSDISNLKYDLTKACPPGTFADVLQFIDASNAYFAAFFNHFSKEIDTRETIKKELLSKPIFVSEYKRCLIDSKMNLYIVMPRLGLSVATAQLTCKTSLDKSGLGDSIARYLSLVYTIAQLNDRGIKSCGITPQNVRLSLDYDPRLLYLNSFEALTLNGSCPPLNPVVQNPPEIFMIFHNKIPLEEQTKRGTRASNLFDSFLLGKLMISFELGYSELNNNNFLNIVKDSRPQRVKFDYKENLAKKQKVSSYLESRLSAKREILYRDGNSIDLFMNKAHELLHKIMIALAKPDYQTRFTTSEAFYILYTLQKLFLRAEDKVDNNDALRKEYELLAQADSLFALDNLKSAMDGNYQPTVKGGEVKRIKSLIDLANRIGLPSYTDLVVEFESSLSQMAERLLI